MQFQTSSLARPSGGTMLHKLNGVIHMKKFHSDSHARRLRRKSHAFLFKCIFNLNSIQTMIHVGARSYQGFSDPIYFCGNIIPGAKGYCMVQFWALMLLQHQGYIHMYISREHQISCLKFELSSYNSNIITSGVGGISWGAWTPKQRFHGKIFLRVKGDHTVKIWAFYILKIRS